MFIDEKVKQLTTIAIGNNVALCQCVADAHKIPTISKNGVWMAPHRMPPYYPNLITTEPNSDVMEHIELLCQRLEPGWGLKDSYANLDLGSNACRLAMTGNWFGASTCAIQNKPPDRLCSATIVQRESDFRRWIRAWDSGMDGKVFPAHAYKDENLQFVLVESEEQIVGGLLLNRSGNGIGMSNWFGDLNSVVWAMTEAVISDQWIVGYTDSEEIVRLTGYGFEQLQAMKVWIFE